MNRIVTGFTAGGEPVIIASGKPATVIHAGRYTTTELWVSDRGPLTAGTTDTSAREWALEPPPGGACFRIVEIAPAAGGASGADGHPAEGADAEDTHAEFQGAHATDSLDYVTILRGEVTLVVGDSEVLLQPGDSVVQQPGVPHDWQNRSSASAVMIGVLLSAR